MRLSVNSDDPGYDRDMIWRAKAYLDGKEVTHCLTADEEEGFVERYVSDENDDLVIGAGRDRLETERLEGKVVIEVIE